MYNISKSGDKMQKAKILFQKLKITSLLDLALLIPSSYNDTTLAASIQLGKYQTFEARVEGVEMINGRLHIRFYLMAFNRQLNSFFFM